MKLLVEMANDQDVECFSESVQGGAKKFFVEGKWAAVDEEVKNGRTYSRPVMESALSAYTKNYINEKRSGGELGHPAGPQLNLDRVSHLIEKLNISVGKDGKAGVYGRAKITENTPMGAIAKSLIEEGMRLGVSTRGLGSIVERNGKKFVHTDYMLSAIDLVSDPSGPGCFVNQVMESVDYQMLEDGRIIQLVVDHAKKKIDEARALKAFASFMTEIRTK